MYVPRVTFTRPQLVSLRRVDWMASDLENPQAVISARMYLGRNFSPNCFFTKSISDTLGSRLSMPYWQFLTAR